METSSATALSERIRDALRTVVDPEAGINIVDLGLVYRLEVTGRDVAIDLTMTSPTCPMGEMIEADARQAVAAVLPEGFGIALQIVWNPPWEPARMSEKARRHFGWDDGG